MSQNSSKSRQFESFAGVGDFFYPKKHVQKIPIKNKKKCRFAKKSQKVTQNQKKASERAAQINQAS